MSAGMTFAQFRELLTHISREHSPNKQVAKGLRRVIYVDPFIDMRTGTVFSVKFRGYGWTKRLHIMNEFLDVEESLYDRCMSFLDGAGEVDGAPKTGNIANDKLAEVVFGEIGKTLADYGAEFGGEEVTFKVPVAMILEEGKELENGNGRDGEEDKNS